MSCDIPKVQLYLYLDGELDSPEALTVERHLETCESCQKETASHQDLRILLRTTLTQEEVPERLWPSIQCQLREESSTVLRPSRWFSRKPLWTAVGAIAALLVLTIGLRLWVMPSVSGVMQEIVDSQIRARLMGVPYNYVSSDPAAIRRWFHDKVAFSISVPTLPDDQFALQGVRLNYFLNRRVAEIAYTSPSHTLSFMMFADREISLNALRTVRIGNRTFYVDKYKGYNTVLWRDGDAFCTLVSDLNSAALLRIAQKATGNLSAS